MLAVLSLSACTGGNEEVYSQFVHLPEHLWSHTVLRHESEYEYANANFTVDVLTRDSLVMRHPVTIRLVDDNGNWTSDGFGSLYQCQMPVADGVRLDSASVILVWQSMPCDTLYHISEVGIDVTRNK